MEGFCGLKKITIENAPVFFPNLRGIINSDSCMEEIDFGDSLIGIYGGFYGMKLKKIRLPESCDIEGSAFGCCDFLQEIEWIPCNDPEKKGYIGPNAFSYCTSLKEVSIPCGVGDSAFKGCTALEKVTILKNNITVGESAFEGCTALKEMDLSYCSKIYDQAFLNCTDLRKVCFPDRLYKLGDNVFQGCPNLEECSVKENKNIKVSSSTTLLNVYNGVLYCRNLEYEDIYDNDGEYVGYPYFTYKLSLYPAGKRSTSFVMPDVTFEGITSKVTEIAGGAFANNLYLEKLTVISGQLKNKSTFEGCASLKEVEILPGGTLYKCLNTNSMEREELPDSMVRIPYRAFKDCTALERVSIPDSYLMIGNSSFEGCTSMKDISLPTELMAISDAAFSGCTALKEVKIPEKLIEIGNTAFCKCDALEKVEIPVGSRLSSIGIGAFLNCSALKTIELPETLDSIGPNAFKECHALTEIRIPNRVTKLGRWVYENCKSAKTVSIGNGIQELEVYSFWGCSGAERLEIGENVEKIGPDAFTGMDNLKVIVCNSLTPPDYPTGFSDEVKRKATLYVPDGASDEYHVDATWEPFTLVEAVEEVSQDEIKVTSHSVMAPEGVIVEIYTIAGYLASRGIGSFSLDLAPGIYIVRTPGSVRKISIM